MAGLNDKQSPISILAVDDIEDNLYIIRKLIEEYLPGIKIMTSTDPGKGLAMAFEHPPHGILLDLKMPGINGIEMCKHLKAHEKTVHVPVILITSQDTTPELRALGLEAGADDFISRPINNVELVARIKVMLRIKRAENELREMNKNLARMVEERTAQLTESESRWRSLTENSPDHIMTLDRDANILFINHTVHDLKKADVIGSSFYDYTLKEYKPTARECFEGVLKTGKPDKFESVYHSKDGISHYFESHVGPIISPGNNEIIGLTVSFRDISDRKIVELKIRESLQENEMLLKEIHHRVKNNMALISSLLVLQADTSDDPDITRTLQDSQSRIRSMALVHEKLYQAENLSKIDFPEYIKSLAMHISQLKGVNSNKASLIIRAENISLGIDLAIPCGLVINELLTNAFKYAFPGDKTGEILIQMRLKDNLSYELVISDNGVGLPGHIDIQNPSTFGLHLVNLLNKQLAGKIEVNREKGTAFTVEFPARSRSKNLASRGS
jgi:PAS domain S-box-containing protein